MSLLASVLSADAPFMSEPMLGIVLACEVPLAIRVGVALLLLLLLCSVPSCFSGCGGVGDRESEMMFWLWSCVNGDGAMRRGSILDMGGVEDGFRDWGCGWE